MNNINSAVVAAIAATLAPIVSAFKARASEVGYARIDMPLLADPNNKKGPVVDGDAGIALLSHFRAVAAALNPQMQFAKATDVLHFVIDTIPGIGVSKPEIKMISYPAGPKTVEDLDPVTGNLVERTVTMPARDAFFFGTPPSGLSQKAQEVNAQLAAKYGALLQG